MRRSIANVRCNFSTIVSRRFIGVPNGGDGASCNQGAASNATQSSQTDVVSDLREAISKSAERRKEAQSGNSSAPVGGPRRVTKPLFFESEKSGMSSKKPVRNEFLRRLDEMEEDSKSTSFPTYDAAAERRRKKVDTLIKEERAKLVVFRDVGMDLDKPILSRDILLIFKYFRYGKEFAIDNELERMLRYFNEHAVNELKIIQDSKLMRGPPTLSPRRKFRQSSQSGTSSSRADGILGLEQSEQFQISSSFPVVQCASMNQFCNFSSSMLRTGGNADGAASEDGVSAVARRSSASFLGKFFAPLLSGTSPGVSSQKPYSQKNKDLFSTLSPSSFRRPAVVIFSQLGQQFGAKADLEWRQLAFQTICPSLAEQLRASTGDSALKDSTSPKVNTKEAGTTAVSQPSVSASSALVLPIDVVSLRSADIYKYKWVQRLYVNRFARSLSKESSSNSDKHRIDAFTACTTFVGSQLLLPFYESMNLRNYLLPHVFLVDHEGVVRWMSGGCPDAFEKNIFKSLLKQLEAEYYQSKR